MPIETLMTHLSRNKDMFVNVSRGIWTLNVTDPAMQVRLRELMNRTR